METVFADVPPTALDELLESCVPLSHELESEEKHGMQRPKSLLASHLVNGTMVGKSE